MEEVGKARKKTENVQHGHVYVQTRTSQPNTLLLLQRWQLLSVPSHFADAF